MNVRVCSCVCVCVCVLGVACVQNMTIYESINHMLTTQRPPDTPELIKTQVHKRIPPQFPLFTLICLPPPFAHSGRPQLRQDGRLPPDHL